MRTDTGLVEAGDIPKPAAGARATIAIAGIALFFTNAVDYAHKAYSGPKPLYWVVAFVAAAAAFAILEPRRPLALLRSPLAYWILFYFVLTTCWAISQTGDPLAMEVLDNRYRSLGFLAAFAILFDEPGLRRAIALAMCAAALLATFTNLAELTGVIRFAEVEAVSRTAGRASGLYGNPNESALGIAFGMAIGVPFARRSWRAPLLMIGSLGVAATFSRSVMLIYLVVLVSLALRRKVAIRPLVAVGLLAIVPALWLGSDRTLAFLDARGVLNENTLGRLQFTAGDSGRADLAREAWRLFETSPVIGHGLGAATDVIEGQSPHNTYLALAAEHGILGLLALPALLVPFMRRRRAAVLPVLLLATGVFSHNVLTHPFLLTVIAFAATDPGDAEPRGSAHE